jgi:imidazolonepropionase-like amidohydrolase
MLALTGGIIYTSPAEDPIVDGVVLVDGKTIHAVGPSSQLLVPRDAKRVDCTGRFITAGFWNSHVHLFERKWTNAGSIPAEELRRQLHETFSRFGFTTVFDLGSSWENTRIIRDRVESGEVQGPRILSTGEGFVPRDGQPPDAVVNLMGVMKFLLPEITAPAMAVAAARRLINAGVDGIKLFASTQRAVPLPEGVIAAAASEAHGSKKPVFVHPNSTADVLEACKGGADVIAHTTPRAGAWNDIVIRAMRERAVALTPTLSLWESFMRHDRISAQDEVVGTAIDQLRAWHAAGGTVIFGTDLGAVDPDPSREYVLMNEAGMSFRDILASLTTNPAKRFGAEKKKGIVAKGYDADLTVLAADSFAAVRYTIREGVIIHGDLH